jgi:hypothetical protein
MARCDCPFQATTVKTYDLWNYWQPLTEIGAVVAAAIYAWIRVRQAYSWPSTQGTVWQAQACETEQGSRFTKNWAAEITYSYVVDGEYYSGIHRIGARTQRGADEKVAGWKGRMLIVRYHPSKHTVSVLLKSDQPGGQLGN